jgi:hypothetical protein
MQPVNYRPISNINSVNNIKPINHTVRPPSPVNIVNVHTRQNNIPINNLHSPQNNVRKVFLPPHNNPEIRENHHVNRVHSPTFNNVTPIKINGNNISFKPNPTIQTSFKSTEQRNKMTY